MLLACHVNRKVVDSSPAVCNLSSSAVIDLATIIGGTLQSSSSNAKIDGNRCGSKKKLNVLRLKKKLHFRRYTIRSIISGCRGGSASRNGYVISFSVAWPVLPAPVCVCAVKTDKRPRSSASSLAFVTPQDRIWS